jgi:hypothetical protein
MLPTFSNMFTVATNPAVTQIVFKNQLEKDGPIIEVAHVVISTADMRELVQTFIDLEAKVAVP